MHIAIDFDRLLAIVLILTISLSSVTEAADVRYTTVEPAIFGTLIYYGDSVCNDDPNAGSPQTGGLVQVFPANSECLVNGTNQSIAMTCNTDGTIDTFETFEQSQSCDTTVRDDSSRANNCGFIDKGTKLKCIQVEVGGLIVPALHYLSETECKNGSLLDSLPATPSYYIPPQAVGTCVPYNDVLYAVHSCELGKSELSSFFRDEECQVSADRDAPLDAVVFGECFSLGEEDEHAVYSSCLTIKEDPTQSGGPTQSPTTPHGNRATTSPTGTAIQLRLSRSSLVSAVVLTLSVFSSVSV